MNIKTLLCVTTMLAGTLAVVRAQEPAQFPFVLPWDDSSHNAIDVGYLNPTPAGVNGYVKAKNGHFYDEKGNRVRFIGVNITSTALFPDKATAEKVAARLHKFGVNIVRVHHMDAPWNNPNFFDPKFKDTQHINPDSLDRLDYFLAQLIKNGIYVNLNLHVSRTYTEADGVPEASKLPELGKIVTFYMPRLIELQKNYARDLLTHVNPYTQKSYADEPGVAVVEINNEDTLLGAAFDNSLDNLTESAKSELLRQWNGWLKTKYKDTDGLRRAWSAADKPFGPNLLQNADFGRGAEHWTLELNQAPAHAKMSLPEKVAPPPDAEGKVLRIDVDALGGQSWHIQFHQAGLDLTEGEPYTVSFWAKADKPRAMSVYAGLDKSDWHHIGLDATAKLTNAWQKFTYAFTATRTLKEHNRLTFVLGDALGTVEFAGISVRPGVETEFPKDATLEKGTVPFGKPVANPAGQDWLTFLVDTERGYMKTMRDYLKNDLKVHANVTGSQASYGGLGGALRESDSDFTDMHAYWQHPDFPHKAWDPVDWRIGNTAMVREADGGTLPGLARYRLAGKPFTVSEYSHPAPSDYQAECVPLLAAFAAEQDWDGFYLFDYNGDRNAYDSTMLKGFFSIDTNPAKMAFLPAAALLFARNDMPLANGELRLRLPADGVPALLAKNGQDIIAEWETAGIRPTDALSKRFSVAFTTGAQPANTPSSPTTPKSPDDIINKPSEKGPIDWQVAGEAKPVFTADSPSSKVIVGFLGGRSMQISGWLMQMAETPRNFAAFTLTALDGKPMEQSGSLLLTAVGGIGNTGMQWNKERNSVGNQWGTGPTVAEGLSANVSIRLLAISATVYALDGSGNRLGKVDSKLSGSVLTFAIGPANKTLWYEIDAGGKPLTTSAKQTNR